MHGSTISNNNFTFSCKLRYALIKSYDEMWLFADYKKFINITSL